AAVSGGVERRAGLAAGAVAAIDAASLHALVAHAVFEDDADRPGRAVEAAVEAGGAGAERSAEVADAATGGRGEGLAEEPVLAEPRRGGVAALHADQRLAGSGALGA